MILIRFPCYCLHFFLENWCSRPLHNAPAGVISIFVIRIPFGFCQALAVWILHDTIFMCDWFVVKIILGTKLHLPKEKKWTVPNQVLLRRRVAVVPTIIEISKYRLMILPNFLLFEIAPKLATLCKGLSSFARKIIELLAALKWEKICLSLLNFVKCVRN